MSDYISGMIYRLTNESPASTNSEWMDGFGTCLKKLSLIDTALHNISFEFLAVRELWENHPSLEHSAKGDDDDVSLNIRDHVLAGLKKIAVNCALFNTAKLYELTVDPVESKHYAPILETLDKESFDGIKIKFSILDYEKLKKVRNKSIAHISNVQYTTLDGWVSELIPTGDLSDFLRTLDPEISDGPIGIHEATERLRAALRNVPGYVEYRELLG